jgi:hypothetical protein
MERHVMYGVEYHAIYSDGSHRVVIGINALHERLLQSKYYQHRRAFYEKHACSKGWCEKATHVDIEFLEHEFDALYMILGNDDVIDHDWYDVCYMK